ncbi:hypothetical protein ACLE20_14220 [Rhizobium sp. YIM 134829]|uniref:hypothetical protein n=1 Tax=Rhizobium sp. YIM 134829 TaxID=3390453 RepID=UPI00397D90D6
MDQPSSRRHMALYLTLIGIIVCAIVAGAVSWSKANRADPAPPAAATSSSP